MESDAILVSEQAECPSCAGTTTSPVENSLSGFFGNLLDTSSYPPRWECGAWTPLEGWLHIVSDVGIFLAYFAIPIALIYCLILGSKNPRLPGDHFSSME